MPRCNMCQKQIKDQNFLELQVCSKKCYEDEKKGVILMKEIYKTNQLKSKKENDKSI